MKTVFSWHEYPVNLRKYGRIPKEPLSVSVFDEPASIRFDRKRTPNLTFGAGPHRCIGSHLAKAEIVTALQEWLMRIPPFSIAPVQKIHGIAGQVMALEHLPEVW